MSKLTQQHVSRRQLLKGVALLGLGAGLSACGAATPAAKSGAGSGVKDLKIMWAQWDPANYLQQLVQDYEKEAGVKVTVIQEPWGSFLNRVSADWAAKGTSFDMVVGDSQWIGQAATQGHYVDLTDWMKGKGIDKTVTPATLQYYGTYNGKYYAFPTEGDALGWAYRKDLFEDPKEKEAFKAKYGYDLGIPADITQLRDIAEFFTRKDKNLYGIAVYTQKDYDAITMGAQNFIFAYGGDWGEKINSDGAVKGLEMYRSLYQFAPPGLSNAFFQELNDAFISGQVAMITNYFAFFPALVNPSINKNFADKVGFFSTRPVRVARWPGRQHQRVHRRRPQGSVQIIHRVVRAQGCPGKVGQTGRIHMQHRGAQVGHLPEIRALQPGFRRNDDLRQGLLQQPGLWRPAGSRSTRVQQVCRRRPGLGQRVIGHDQEGT
jgi:ABC-type glycerol-3-phosphate transport system substrate-binding protein